MQNAELGVIAAGPLPCGGQDLGKLAAVFRQTSASGYSAMAWQSLTE